MRELGSIISGLATNSSNGSVFLASANRPFRLLEIGVWIYTFGNPPAFTGDIEYEAQFGIKNFPGFPPLKMVSMLIPGQDLTNPLKIESSGFPDKEILYPGAGQIYLFANVGLYSPGNPGNNFFAISPYDPAIFQVEWL